MPTLIERLDKMGIKKGSQIGKKEKSQIDQSLEELLHADAIHNQFGRVLKVENFYPFGHRHGNVVFHGKNQSEVMKEVGKVKNKSEDLNDLVFLDTETTGLSGGTGTLAFLIGMAVFEQNGLRLIQFLIEEPTDEQAMLLEFSNFFSDQTTIVSFNGKSFDIPLLKTRFILNKMPITFSDCAHLDLLHVSRKIWRNRLESRSLKDLEQEIIEIPRSNDEIPGWMIPEVYFNYLRTGDSSQLAGVIYHNGMDILSLVALYLIILSLLENEIYSERIHAMDAYSLGKIFQDIGQLEKSTSLFQYCLKNKLSNQVVSIDARSRLAANYKKIKMWDKAVQYWNENADAGDMFSCLELAKYFEHICRDYQQALHWTMKAFEQLDRTDLSRYKKKVYQSEFIYRQNRLKKRIIYVQPENS